MRMWDMWKGCLQTFRSNRICLKLAYFLRKLQTLRGNNSRIIRIKNAKFSRYCFHMNTNIYGDFQICISVNLKETYNSLKKWPLILWWVSNKTIMEVGNIKKAATFKSFLHLSYKNLQWLFLWPCFLNIFMRQTFTFLGATQNYELRVSFNAFFGHFQKEK